MNRSEEQRFKNIVQRIPKNTSSILDIGCVRHNSEKRAAANLHRYLVENTDCDIKGIDINEQEVQKMRRKQFDVEVADAASYNPGHQFDAIIAGELIEHLKNLAEFFKNTERLLSSDGRLIVTTPSPDAFVYFRKALLRQSNNETHTCWIDPYNLEQVLQVTETELSLLSWSYLPPSGGLSSILWKTGRKRASSPTYIAQIT